MSYKTFFILAIITFILSLTFIAYVAIAAADTVEGAVIENDTVQINLTDRNVTIDFTAQNYTFELIEVNNILATFNNTSATSPVAFNSNISIGNLNITLINWTLIPNSKSGNNVTANITGTKSPNYLSFNISRTDARDCIENFTALTDTIQNVYNCSFLSQNSSQQIFLAGTNVNPLNSQRQTSNAFIFTPVTEKSSSLIKALTNSISFNQVAQRAASFTRSLTNALDLTDAFTRLASFTRSLASAIDLNDAVTRLTSYTRFLVNSIDITDNIQLLFTRVRLTTNAIVLTNLGLRITGGQSFEALVSNTIDLSDAMGLNIGRFRGLTNALDLTDAFTRLASFKRSLTNALDLTDAFTSAIGRLRTITQALDITDSITSSIGRIGQVINAIDITDTTQYLLTRGRLLTNAIDITDTITRLISFTRSLTTPISLIERLLADFGVRTNISVVNALDITDSITSSLSRLRQLTNALDLTDAFTRLASFKRSLTNALDLTDAFTSAIGRLRTITQALDITDSITSSIGRIGQVINAIDITDTTQYLLTRGRLLTNAIDITDTITRLISFTRSLTNALDLTDAFTSAIGRLRGVSNALDITESISKLVSFVRSSTNQLTLTSPIRASYIIQRFVNLAFDITDSAGRLQSFTRLITQSFNLSGIISRVVSLQRITSLQFLVTAITSPIFKTISGTFPPSGGVSGGGGGAGYVSYPTRITQLPTTAVEFTKWNVLREVMAGQSVVESVTVKNKGIGTLDNVQIKVSGTPADWTSIVPSSVNLDPNETKTFNLAISVPKEVNSGDYKLLITLKNSKVEDSNFMIVRVKSYGPAYDKPIVTRTVQLDYETDRTKVTLDVNNPVKYYKLVEVQEEIPKSLAQSASEVEFNPNPDVIIRGDPLVQWSLKDMAINDTRTISYLTKGILQEFTGYIYFPLKELNIIETKLPTGLKLVDIGVGTLFTGKSSIGKITIQNIGDEAKKLEFSMSLPSGWKIVPEKIEATIGAHEKKEIKFSIVVPEDVSPGDYIGTSIVIWDKDTYIKELVLHVSSVPSYFGILIFIVIVIGIVVYIVYKSRREQERPLVSKFRGIVSKIRQKEQLWKTKI